MIPHQLNSYLDSHKIHNVIARYTPRYLKDYGCKFSEVVKSPSPGSQSISSDSAYPIVNFVSYNNFSSSYCPYITSLNAHYEPKSYSQAIKDPRWCEAIAADIAVLEKNSTWTLEFLLEGKKPIGFKWVFKIKHKPDGSIERYKVRFVAK